MAPESGPLSEPAVLAENHMPIAHRIAGRMKRRYAWVAMDDLYSYALLGLTRAAQTYDATRGVPFASYAWQKAMYWAIDQMRKDSVVRRRSVKFIPRVVALSDLGEQEDRSYQLDPPDRSSERARTRMEARDLCAVLLRHLRARDRQLLLLYYAEQLTFREIAEVLDIPLGTVKSRMHLAVMQLKETFHVGRRAREE